MKDRSDIEHREQKALFVWASYASSVLPELELLFAIPNGGDRNPIVAAKMKAEGVKAGVPDICLPIARGGHHALYIELKRPADPLHKRRAGSVGSEQRQWIARLRDAGSHVVVAYGWFEAKQAIMNYLREGTS